MREPPEIRPMDPTHDGPEKKWPPGNGVPVPAIRRTRILCEHPAASAAGTLADAFEPRPDKNQANGSA
jgi:hypothetical protein